MENRYALKHWRILAFCVFLCSCGHDKEANPSPDSRRVIIRLTASDVSGLDAKFYLYRQQLTGGMQLQATGSASDNARVDQDDLRQQVGERSRIVIGFDAVKASNSVRPRPTSRYIAEILVDGSVISQAVVDSTTPINGNGNLFAIAEAEIK